MTIEKSETGLTKNRRLRAFDEALENADEIGMVVSDADSGKVAATLAQEGAVETAEHLADKYGFDMELREADSAYPRRAVFKIDYPEF